MNILADTKKGLERFWLYRRAWIARNQGRAEGDLFYALKYLAFSYFHDMTFLQIGGNDGRSGDPIHQFVTEYQWNGVIVEPQKSVYANGLQKTYAGYQNVSLENCAIDKESAERTLYKISFSQARWATGLATFDRGTLERLIESGYVAEMASQEGVTPPTNKEDYIAEESVVTLTVSQVLEKNGFENIRFLIVDTEGYDGQIIKSIDFSRVTPSAILFEWIHLVGDEYRELESLLGEHGFRLRKIGTNCFAQRIS